MIEKEKNTLKLYLIFVFVISAVVQAVWIYSGDAGSLISQLLMVVPMAVALVLKFIFYRKQPLLGFRAGKPVYYILAVIIPLCYIGLGYALYWLFVPGAFVGTGVMIAAVSGAAGIENLPLAIALVFGLSVLLGMVWDSHVHYSGACSKCRRVLACGKIGQRVARRHLAYNAKLYKSVCFPVDDNI